jgi:hypothetical protein
MSETEMKKRLENLDKQIRPMPEEQKSFLLGYMEGVCQMSEKHRKELLHQEE